ncbi:hypothetical protein [Paenibacillus sp. SYP-B4298]|nr:hypothetical protein [Paenibacillus sp. SYP-B4298]
MTEDDRIRLVTFIVVFVIIGSFIAGIGTDGSSQPDSSTIIV